MGRPCSPLPVTLICGILYADDAARRHAEHSLLRQFGAISIKSADEAFTATDYYGPEMGEGLRRIFIAFERVVTAERLVSIKLWTNSLELRLASRNGKRKVNLDPGYISLSKLVLATTKSHAHRIYVGRGLFEEVTLFFKGGKFQPAPWTYPDLKTSDRLLFFDKVRDRLLTQLTQSHGPSDLSRSV